MFISFVFGVYDSREIRGTPAKKLRNDVDWDDDAPRGERRKGYAYGIGLPLTKAERAAAKPKPPTPEWGASWPKSNRNASFRKQGKFVAERGNERWDSIRPACSLSGRSIEPRVERTYAFHQDYLGLFTFRFSFPPVSAIAEEDLYRAIAGLSETLVAFRVGEQRRQSSKGKMKQRGSGPEPALHVCRLRDCGPALAKLQADSRSMTRFQKEPRSHVEPMPPTVFVHDVDGSLPGWQAGDWVRCRRVGALDTFVLRRAPTVTTQRMQSYIAAHLMEGYSLREMAEYVRSRGRAFQGRSQLYTAQRSIGRAATARKAAQALRVEVRRSIDGAVERSDCTQLNRERDLALQILGDLTNREVAELLTSVAQGARI